MRRASRVRARVRRIDDTRVGTLFLVAGAYKGEASTRRAKVADIVFLCSMRRVYYPVSAGSVWNR